MCAHLGGLCGPFHVLGMSVDVSGCCLSYPSVLNHLQGGVGGSVFRSGYHRNFYALYNTRNAVLLFRQ